MHLSGQLLAAPLSKPTLDPPLRATMQVDEGMRDIDKRST